MQTALLTPTSEFMKEIAQVAEQLLRLVGRLIWLVAKQTYGIELRRNAADIYHYNTMSISRRNLQEGDLVFFRMNGDNISHVGIYLKNNAFAHASTSKGVTISSLDEPYYAKTFYQAGRMKTITL